MENNPHPTFANGKICYIEIPALDIEKSAGFYKKVFGWNIRNDNQGNISFDDTVCEVSGMWVTGRKASTEPGLLISVMVDSIVDTLALVTENGGKIVKEPSLNAAEKVAHFSDPANNLISLYQSKH